MIINKIKRLKRNYHYSVIPFELIKVFYRMVLNNLATLYWKMAGVSIGNGSIIERGFRTNCPKKIRIGKNCLITKGVSISTEEPLNDNILEIEDNVQVNRNVQLDITGGLLLKQNVLISSSSTIFTHSHGKDPRSNAQPSSLTIGENVWIGERVLVLQGVNDIKPYSIIGAGTILTKDTEDRSIVVGASTRTLDREN